MATVKRGQLTASGEWRKHLRWMRRQFWKGERQAAEAQIRRVAPHEEATPSLPDAQVSSKEVMEAVAG